MMKQNQEQSPPQNHIPIYTFLDISKNYRTIYMVSDIFHLYRLLFNLGTGQIQENRADVPLS